jgi:4-hydroxybenzoate polyprenyltransferase
MKTMPTSTPESFLARVWIYSKEMFPVLIYLPYVVALYICLNFSSQAIAGSTISMDINGIVGMITAFFIMLQMRTFDDLKDIEIDKDLFPWRATPRKAVLKSDIQILSIFSFVVLVLTNVIFGQETINVFVLMMVYAILTFKWFFAEEFHRKNLLFTMATHQPLPWVINYFLIHTALASGDTYDAFTINHWILLAIFSLPITAWEVSRKIRAIGHETEYETFSMIFGTRPATWIPFICLLLTGLLSIYIANILGLNLSFIWITIALMIYVIFIYGRFLKTPIVKNNNLTNTAMIFTTAVFLNFLLHVLMNYEVVNQL